MKVFVNVFVVGTGRCGTSTFYQACRHCTNYSTGHETMAGRVKIDRYPPNHIEVDASLWVYMGSLLRYYPQSYWVHLIRNKEDTIQSLMATSSMQLEQFGQLYRERFKCDQRELAEVLYDSVNDNISALLPYGRSMTIRIEDIKSYWPKLWDVLGMQGCFEKSLAEWNKCYNPRGNRGRDNYH